MYFRQQQEVPGILESEMMLTGLTTSQQTTFRILGIRSNLASVDLLAEALASTSEAIRRASLQTLIARGGTEEMAAILSKIENCTGNEIATLKDLVPLLLDPIDAGLASSETEKRRKSLRAIAKLEIASHFHHLVQVAQSQNDEEQLLSEELLLSLARKLGGQARRSQVRTPSESSREHLLMDLWRAMELSWGQRNNSIVDAWLFASHWEDSEFKSIFDPSRRDSIAQVFLRQLKHSHQSETLELIAGILWSKKPFYEAIQLLAEHKAAALTCILAGMVESLGITPQVKKNLGNNLAVLSIDCVDYSSDALSLDDRISIQKLLMVTQSPPDRMLSSVNQLLATRDPAAEAACAVAIRNLSNLKQEIVVMVLSDCFDSNDMEPYVPPPWKASLRLELERMIELYPYQAASVKSSIEFIFSDFRCEEMFKNLDDWPESHLYAYGKLVRIADKGFIGFLERESQSQSPAKRLRAMKVARMLGVDDMVREIVAEALNDRDEKVRIEAICTISQSIDVQIAIEILSPLLRDEDPIVKLEAESVLERLRGYNR